MADKKLNIKVGLKGAKKAEKGLGKVNSSMKSMARTAVSAGAAFFGARAIISGLSTSVRLAGEQEQAEKKLEVALGRTSRALLNHASALQKMTTFGDEAIIGVQSSLAAFIDSEEQIKLATEATLDMAVAMGMDLKSAGDLVAKTLGSSTNAMSRYGIEVVGAVGSTERLESLTNNVAKLFGGQAKAQADTYAGSVQQMKNSLGDMAENMGKIVIPVFEKLAPHLNTAIKFWSEYLNKGDAVKESTSLLSPEIQRLNKEIQSQSDLVDYLSNESYITFEQVNLRAIDQGRTKADQLRFESDEYIKQVETLNNLIIAKEKHLTIEKAIQDSLNITLGLRRDDLEIDIQKVKVIDVNRGAIKNKYAEEMKFAALSGQTAMQSMKSVVRAETMEAVAGYLASILKSVPFPANLILAAGGGGLVAGMMDKAMAGIPNKFAEGGIVPGTGTGDTIPAMLTPGEVILNQAQQQNLVGGMGGVTINITAPLVDETVIDHIIPAIQKAHRMNLA
jgi:hypothetical protein